MLVLLFLMPLLIYSLFFSWTKERRVLLVMSKAKKKWVSVRPLPSIRNFPQQYDVSPVPSTARCPIPFPLTTVQCFERAAPLKTCQGGKHMMAEMGGKDRLMAAKHPAKRWSRRRSSTHLNHSVHKCEFPVLC